MKEELIKIKNQAESERIAIDKKYSIIASLRLVVFLIGVVIVFAALKNHNTILLISAVVPVIIFIVLVKYHGDLDDRLLDSKAKINVINRYLMRMNNGWKAFEDNGKEFPRKD